MLHPQSFNYAMNQSSPSVFGFIYEGLITENGETGQIEPALAESWEISEDNKRIVFTLRGGLKWSDGEPLTANDVVFTYNDIFFNELIPTDIRDVLAREVDEAKRKAIYAETQRLAQEYLPFIHLVNPLSLAAVRNNIQGVKYTAVGGALWNVYELKMAEE